MDHTELKQRMAELLRSKGLPVYEQMSLPNRRGLPREPYVTLRANWSPVDGDGVIFVFGNRVELQGLRTPYDFHAWEVCSSTPYKTEDELLAAIARYMDPPRATLWDVREAAD